MSVLFNFLSLASFVCLVVGVAEPETFTFLFRKKLSRSQVTSIFLTSTVVCFIIFNIITLSTNKRTGDPTISQDQRAATEVSIDTPTPTIYVVPTKSPIEQDKQTIKDAI